MLAKPDPVLDLPRTIETGEAETRQAKERVDRRKALPGVLRNVFGYYPRQGIYAGENARHEKIAAGYTVRDAYYTIVDTPPIGPRDRFLLVEPEISEAYGRAPLGSYEPVIIFQQRRSQTRPWETIQAWRGEDFLHSIELLHHASALTREMLEDFVMHTRSMKGAAPTQNPVKIHLPPDDVRAALTHIWEAGYRVVDPNTAGIWRFVHHMHGRILEARTLVRDVAGQWIMRSEYAQMPTPGLAAIWKNFKEEPLSGIQPQSFILLEEKKTRRERILGKLPFLRRIFSGEIGKHATVLPQILPDLPVAFHEVFGSENLKPAIWLEKIVPSVAHVVKIRDTTLSDLSLHVLELGLDAVRVRGRVTEQMYRAIESIGLELECDPAQRFAASPERLAEDIAYLQACVRALGLKPDTLDDMLGIFQQRFTGSETYRTNRGMYAADNIAHGAVIASRHFADLLATRPLAIVENRDAISRQFGRMAESFLGRNEQKIAQASPRVPATLKEYCDDYAARLRDIRGMSRQADLFKPENLEAQTDRLYRRIFGRHEIAPSEVTAPVLRRTPQ